MTLSEVTFGCYPRDDVFFSWAKDESVREGTATISRVRDDGTHEKVHEITLGDLQVFHPDGVNGDMFVVDIRGVFGGQLFERQVTFTATSNENDVYVSAVGPGAVAHPGDGKGWFRKKTRYSGFEFGVLVMGATTGAGTRVVGRSGPLVQHAPTDGVGQP